MVGHKLWLLSCVLPVVIIFLEQTNTRAEKQTDRRTKGRMDGRMGGRIDAQNDGRADRSTERRADILVAVKQADRHKQYTDMPFRVQIIMFEFGQSIHRNHGIEMNFPKNHYAKTIGTPYMTS